MYRYFLKNVTFNDPFVLNLLNVANCYIFKCQSVIKVKNGGRMPSFLDKLHILANRSNKSNGSLYFSAVQYVKSNGLLHFSADQYI